MDGEQRLWKSDRNDQVCHCWQDVSVRTWGTTAQDVADNFVQRWNYTRAHETLVRSCVIPCRRLTREWCACLGCRRE